jgi:hypothetical protein
MTEMTWPEHMADSLLNGPPTRPFDPDYDEAAELEWESAQPVDRVAVARAKARRAAYRDNRIRQLAARRERS